MRPQHFGLLLLGLFYSLGSLGNCLPHSSKEKALFCKALAAFEKIEASKRTDQDAGLLSTALGALVLRNELLTDDEAKKVEALVLEMTHSSTSAMPMYVLQTNYYLNPNLRFHRLVHFESPDAPKDRSLFMLAFLAENLRVLRKVSTLEEKERPSSEVENIEEKTLRALTNMLYFKTADQFAAILAQWETIANTLADFAKADPDAATLEARDQRQRLEQLLAIRMVSNLDVAEKMNSFQYLNDWKMVEPPQNILVWTRPDARTKPIDHAIYAASLGVRSYTIYRDVKQTSIQSFLETLSTAEFNGTAHEETKGQAPAGPHLSNANKAYEYLANPSDGGRRVLAIPSGSITSEDSISASRVTALPLGPFQPDSNGTPLALDSIMEKTTANALFTIEGSNTNRGLFFTPYRVTDTGKGVYVRMGISVDAYHRKGGNQDIKFWMGAGFLPSQGTHFVGVRMESASSGPLGNLFDDSEKRNWYRWAGFPESPPPPGIPALTVDQHLAWVEGVCRDPDAAAPAPNGGPLSEAERARLKNAVVQLDDIRQGAVYTQPTHSPIVCVRGCLSREPAAIEPESGWAMFSIIPGYKQSLVFETVATPLVTQKNPVAFNPWGGMTALNFNIMEIAHDPKDFRFAPMHPGYLASQATLPTKVNDKDHYWGVLNYAEALERSLQADGWLNPSGSLSFVSLANIFHLKVLFEASRAPDSAFGGQSTEAAPWKERREFLKQALVVLSVEISMRYLPKLSESITNTSRHVKNLQLLYDRMKKVAEGNHELSKAELEALLKEAADLTGSSPQVIESRENLSEYVKEAELGIRQYLQNQVAQLAYECLAASRYTYRGSRLVSPMTLESDIIKICEPYREKDQ